MPNNQTIVSLDDVQLPYSLEAEQAVLGSILTEPDCITQVLILLKADHFYLPQHKAIFNITRSVSFTFCHLVSFTEEMRRLSSSGCSRHRTHLHVH